MSQSEVFTGPRLRAAQTTLAILVAVNVMSQLDRQIMNVLLPKIQPDLLLSDAQAGWLAGFAFAVCYSIAGPSARPLRRSRKPERAHRRRPRRLERDDGGLWSRAQLRRALHRPDRRRHRRGGLCPRGPFADLRSFSPGPPRPRPRDLPARRPDRHPARLDRRRLALRPARLALGLLPLRRCPASPSRSSPARPCASPSAADSTARRTRASSRSARCSASSWRRPAMRQILVAATLHTLAVGAQVTFNFMFLTRVHDLSGTEAGIVIGLLTGIFGAIGTYLGGWLGDRFGARDARWYLWWLALGGIASIPFSIAAYLDVVDAVRDRRPLDQRRRKLFLHRRLPRHRPVPGPPPHARDHGLDHALLDEPARLRHRARRSPARSATRSGARMRCATPSPS